MNLQPLINLIQAELNDNSEFFISASRKIQPTDEGYEEAWNDAEIIREEFREISDFVLDEYELVIESNLKTVNELIESALGNKFKVELEMKGFGGRGIEDFYLIKGIYVKSI